MTDPAAARSVREAAQRRRGLRIAAACFAFTCGMVGAAYASVPLYRIFCQVTGYGGTTQVAEAAPRQVSEREINVRFDANVMPGLALRFQPTERQVRLKLGEVRQTTYTVKNLTNKPVTARAEYGVTPDYGGGFFNKIACFCFTDQTLAPFEERTMPVIFFVSPEAAEDADMKRLPTLTLSYTFFGSSEPAGGAVAARAGAAEKPKG